jgi:hypothetical protein
MSCRLKRGVGRIIRRVLKSGNGSLSITIPIDWAKRNNIAAHTEVMLTESNDGLLISPELENSPQTTELKIRGPITQATYSLILGAYKKGYDVIQLKLEPALTTNAHSIEKFLSRLRGIRYCTQNDTIIVEHQDEEDESHAVLKKAFHSIIYLAKKLNVPNKTSLWLDEINELHERIFYYCAYSVRLMHKSARGAFTPILHQYSLAWSLQGLSEITQRIAQMEMAIMHRNPYHHPTYILADILKSIYDIYYNDLPTTRFFVLYNELEMQTMQTVSNMPIWEHAIMFEHICKQLVMQLGTK